MTDMVEIMPKSITPFNNRVCALAYDRMPLFEFSIAVEIFGLERPEMGPDWYRFGVASLDPLPVRTTAGLALAADGGLEKLHDAGTIVIAGWHYKTRPVPPELIAALRQAHDRGARILSICSGAFLLAAAGLLDGKRATTHWRYADDFRRLYPQVELLPDVLYVDEGQILTSAGSAAGLDIGLYLIRRDFGPAAANTVARRLVVPAHRDGGQAQFVEKSVPIDYESKRLGPLLDHMRGNLDHEHRVIDLARRAGMSQRTFLRRFTDATGTTPAKWLMGVRLNAARDHLEQSTLSVEDIAALSGFGTTANLRHHFREQLNTTPSAYRANFGRTIVMPPQILEAIA